MQAAQCIVSLPSRLGSFMFVRACCEAQRCSRFVVFLWLRLRYISRCVVLPRWRDEACECARCASNEECECARCASNEACECARCASNEACECVRCGSNEECESTMWLLPISDEAYECASNEACECARCASNEACEQRGVRVCRVCEQRGVRVCKVCEQRGVRVSDVAVELMTRRSASATRSASADCLRRGELCHYSESSFSEWNDFCF